MIKYMEFKDFLMERSSFLNEWLENDIIHSKSELAYVAYEGEQSIILVSVDKKFISDEKHAFITLLQKLIVTDYYFPNDIVEYHSMDNLEELYNNVIWE